MGFLISPGSIRRAASASRSPAASGGGRRGGPWPGAAGGGGGVLGRGAPWPAEPVRGLLVSDRFLSFTSMGSPPPGFIHPADREAWARDALARAERSTDLAALRAYLPDLTAAEYAQESARPDPYAHPVSALRRIL